MKTTHFPPVFVIIILFCPLLLWCQSDVLFTNSKTIDPARYEGILQSPYLLEHWQAATITSKEADPIEVEELNYNAYTKTIEIRKENRFIELDPSWYEQVLLKPKEGEAMVFQKTTIPTAKGQFMQLLYDGNGQLFKQVEMNISKKTFQNVGETREVERFVPRTTYHWIQEGNHKSFKLNKKQIIKSLGNKKQIETFLKSNKLKLNKEETLVRLFEHLDTIE